VRVGTPIADLVFPEFPCISLNEVLLPAERKEREGEGGGAKKPKCHLDITVLVTFPLSVQQNISRRI